MTEVPQLSAGRCVTAPALPAALFVAGTVMMGPPAELSDCAAASTIGPVPSASTIAERFGPPQDCTASGVPRLVAPILATTFAELEGTGTMPPSRGVTLVAGSDTVDS
jgi:hypothetical protein